MQINNTELKIKQPIVFCKPILNNTENRQNKLFNVSCKNMQYCCILWLSSGYKTEENNNSEWTKDRYDQKESEIVIHTGLAQQHRNNVSQSLNHMQFWDKACNRLQS